MSISLAIIIPAYKSKYLQQALDSIATQTNQDFNVYIGDDASPEDLEKIVEPYLINANFHYKKFEENLGSTSLTKQWERCIALSKDEEWIWLFSDDDIMEANCVEQFNNLNKNTDNLYRFSFEILSEEGKLQGTNFPNEETAASFLENRLLYRYNNVISNYIFSRKSFVQHNGFIDFPLAWCSDDASILNFLDTGKLILIPNAKIRWRYSGENITSLNNDNVVLQKAQARANYVEWLMTQKYDCLKSISDFENKLLNWFLNGIKWDGLNPNLFSQYYNNSILNLLKKQKKKSVFKSGIVKALKLLKDKS